jgi:hypothetical protein
LADGLAGTLSFFTDLCHVQSARAAGEVGRICAELAYGYNRHPVHGGQTCTPCQQSVKAGPCVEHGELEEFARIRSKLDACLTGARLAKDRAASALSTVMIPEALDYPV